MMKAGKWLAISALAATMTLAPNAVAQGQDGNRQRGGGGGNFDPAQMRQRMMERYKEMLEVTNDDEWKALEPLVTKVMEARMQQVGGMGRGMFGGPRRGGGDQGGGGAAGGGERRGGFMGQQPNPAAETLEKAVEAKAGKAELKAAITKYAEARKAKQAELEVAQENLRKVLTTRQEAIATLNGLL